MGRQPLITVITYGTFDLFHIGHLQLLRRARALGDRLVVAVSTDEFNAVKGKKTIIPYAHRAEIVTAIDCVDQVIPEESWAQKPNDIIRFSVSKFVMGEDWAGKFDDLRELCEVVYLPRTDGVSSTSLKQMLAPIDHEHISKITTALETIRDIVDKLR